MSGEACLRATKAGKNVCGSLLRKLLHYLCCIALILGDGNAVRAFSPSQDPLAASVGFFKTALNPASSAGSRSKFPSSRTYLRSKGDFHNETESVFEGAVHLEVGGTFSNHAKFGGKEGTHVQATTLYNLGAQLGLEGETSIQAKALNNWGYVEGQRSRLIGNEVNVSVDSLDNNVADLGGSSKTHIQAKTVKNVSAKIGDKGLTLLQVEEWVKNFFGYYALGPHKGKPYQGSKVIGDEVRIVTPDLYNLTSHIAGKNGTTFYTNKMKNEGGHTGGGQTTSIFTEELINQTDEEGKSGGIGGDQIKILAALISNFSHIISQGDSDIGAKTLRNEGAYIGSTGKTKIVAEKFENLRDSRGESTTEGQEAEVVAKVFLNKLSRVSAHAETKIQADVVQNEGGTLGGGGKTSVKGEVLVENVGGKIQGGKSLHVWSGKDIVSRTTLRTRAIPHGQKVELDQQARFLVNDSTPEGTLNVDAHGKMVLEGMEIRHQGQGEARLWAWEQISLPAFELGVESQSYVDDGDKQETKKDVSLHPAGTYIQSQGPCRSYSKGDSEFKKTHFHCPSVDLAAGGKMVLSSARHREYHRTHWKTKNPFWRTQKNYGQEIDGIQQTHINSPGWVQVRGAGGIVVDRVANAEGTGLDPGVGRALQGQNNVTYSYKQSTSRRWEEKERELTPTSAALIGLGVAAMTGNVGISVAQALGLAKGTAAFAATQAAVQAVIAQTAFQVVQHKGDMQKVLDGLLSFESLRGILAAMVTAGLTQGGLNGLASTSSILPRVDPIFQVGGHGSLQMGAAQSASMVGAGFVERLPAHILSGSISTFINGALSGPSAMGRSALWALSTALGTEASLILGPAYHTDNIPWLPHKIAHGALGCLTGAIANAGENMGIGCASGAAGAVVGEIAGEAYLNKQIPGLVAGHKTSDEVIHQTTNMGRLAGGMAAAAIGGDVNTGAQTAGVAVENNVVFLIPLMVTAGLAGYATMEGDGDPRKGLEKVHKSEDTISRTWEALKKTSVGQQIASGGTELVQLTYETFPNAVDRLNRGLAGVGEGLGAAITFMDTRTGHVASRFWNDMDPSIQDQLLGGAKLASWIPGVGGVVAGAGKVATAVIFSTDVKKFSGVAKNVTKFEPPKALPKPQGTQTLSLVEQARRYQGNPDYPGVDDFKPATLNKGDIVLGAAPGQSNFYTSWKTFNTTDGTAKAYYEKLQIEPNKDHAFPRYRSGVTVYEVKRDGVNIAYGTTLKNPDYGPGKGDQFFIPTYEQDLIPLYSIPFKGGNK